MSYVWSVSNNSLPVRPRRRDVALNYGHPLAQGLVLCFDYSDANASDVVNHKDLVTQAVGVPNFGDPLMGPLGIARRFGGGGDVDNWTTPSIANSLIQWSLEMIFCPSTGVDGGIIQKGSSLSAQNGQPFIALNWNSGSLYLDEGYAVNSGEWQSAASYTSGRWHHCVITHDTSSVGNAPIFYKNGQVIGQTLNATPNGTRAIDDTAMNIGTGFNGNYSFQGYVSYVRVWNRILAPQEAMRLFCDPWQIFCGSLSQIFPAEIVNVSGKIMRLSSLGVG